jgi:hypothetical protein
VFMWVVKKGIVVLDWLLLVVAVVGFDVVGV